METKANQNMQIMADLEIEMMTDLFNKYDIVASYGILLHEMCHFRFIVVSF